MGAGASIAAVDYNRKDFHFLCCSLDSCEDFVYKEEKGEAEMLDIRTFTAFQFYSCNIIDNEIAAVNCLHRIVVSDINCCCNTAELVDVLNRHHEM